MSEFQKEIAKIHDALLERQEPLGADFEAVWDANAADLYESSDLAELASARCVVEAAKTVLAIWNSPGGNFKKALSTLDTAIEAYELKLAGDA